MFLMFGRCSLWSSSSSLSWKKPWNRTTVSPAITLHFAKMLIQIQLGKDTKCLLPQQLLAAQQRTDIPGIRWQLRQRVSRSSTAAAAAAGRSGFLHGGSEAAGILERWGFKRPQTWSSSGSQRPVLKQVLVELHKFFTVLRPKLSNVKKMAKRPTFYAQRHVVIFRASRPPLKSRSKRPSRRPSSIWSNSFSPILGKPTNKQTNNNNNKNNNNNCHSWSTPKRSSPVRPSPLMHGLAQELKLISFDLPILVQITARKNGLGLAANSLRKAAIFETFSVKSELQDLFFANSEKHANTMPWRVTLDFGSGPDDVWAPSKTLRIHIAVVPVVIAPAYDRSIIENCSKSFLRCGDLSDSNRL